MCFVGKTEGQKSRDTFPLNLSHEPKVNIHVFSCIHNTFSTQMFNNVSILLAPDSDPELDPLPDSDVWNIIQGLLILQSQEERRWVWIRIY
jgi:hypothetical protein